MIGDGELRAEIEKQLVSLGFKDSYLILNNRSDIPELLSAMDCFVFPSRFEGLPVAFMEAQGAGLKAVTSDNVSSDAFATDRVYVLSLNESAETWAETVLSDNMKPACQEDKIGQFDLSNIIDKLLQLYAM